MTADLGPAAPAPTFRSALRSWRLRRLLVAHVAGTVGQQVLTLAVGLAVLERTSSGLWVSVTVALAFAPYALLSGYAGTLADRCSRSAVLAWSSTIRVVCAGVLSTGLLLGWPLPVIVLVAALAAVAATPSYPALAAATPQCVPAGNLPAANALVTGLENIGWIAGPGVLGLFLLAGHGPVAAVAATIGLFAVATAAASGVGLDRPARPEAAGWHSELLVAARLVVGDRLLRRLLTILVVDNLLYGYLVVAIVLIGTGPGSTGDSLGYLNTALTVGAVLAMPVVNRLADTPRTLGLVMAGFGLSLLLLGLTGLSPAAIALVGCAGAATLIAEVLGVTMIQRGTPEQVHARVFGIYDQLAVGSVALGSLLAGPLADAVGSGGASVLVAVTGLLVTGVATLALRRN
ncbi:MAG TPA: MFS transporter [Pseudonocardia sp.]|nr:MFS transporter [Pseudonocardia sp.]